MAKIGTVWVLLVAAALGQEAAPGPSKPDQGLRSLPRTGISAAQLQKEEERYWEAFKNKDKTPFAAMPDNSISLDDHGVQDKAKLIASINDCEVKSYSLEHAKLLRLDAASAILYYTANVEGTCGGKRIPSPVQASTVYHRQDGKWVPMFHQESVPRAAS